MKDTIAIVIQNVFDISPDMQPNLSNTTKDIPSFLALLTLLQEETCAPKELAMALESVLLEIKSKKKPTEAELAFLHQIHELIELPRYQTENNEESAPSSRFNM